MVSLIQDEWNNVPEVSVVLPVFNAAGTIGEAVESILGQTYTNFELIIVDDGSTDETSSVIKSFQDPRIRVLHQANRGAGAARRAGVQAAKGRYVAVQDADDLSMPRRLEKQVDFLNTNPKIVAVGSWSEIVNNMSAKRRFHRHPTGTGSLAFLLIFDAYLVATSVMIRREALLSVGNYRDIPYGLEDFDLWFRLLKSGDITNLAEVLVKYREIDQSLSRSRLVERREMLQTIGMRNLCEAARVNVSTGNLRAAQLVISKWWGVEADTHSPISLKARVVVIIWRAVGFTASSYPSQILRVLLLGLRVQKRVIV